MSRLAEVAEFAREDARRRGVRLEVATAPDLPHLLADPVQLQQGLLNFVTSASDAVEAAGRAAPRVSLSAAAVPGGVVFAVEDTGDGVPAAARAKIVDAFHSGRARGMGMGLAIARSIAEAHGGRNPGRVRRGRRDPLPADPPPRPR